MPEVARQCAVQVTGQGALLLTGQGAAQVRLSSRACVPCPSSQVKMQCARQQASAALRYLIWFLDDFLPSGDGVPFHSILVWEAGADLLRVMSAMLLAGTLQVCILLRSAFVSLAWAGLLGLLGLSWRGLQLRGGRFNFDPCVRVLRLSVEPIPLQMLKPVLAFSPRLSTSQQDNLLRVRSAGAAQVSGASRAAATPRPCVAGSGVGVPTTFAAGSGVGVPYALPIGVGVPSTFPAGSSVGVSIGRQQAAGIAEPGFCPVVHGSTPSAGLSTLQVGAGVRMQRADFGDAYVQAVCLLFRLVVLGVAVAAAFALDAFVMWSRAFSLLGAIFLYGRLGDTSPLASLSLRLLRIFRVSFIGPSAGSTVLLRPFVAQSLVGLRIPEPQAQSPAGCPVLWRANWLIFALSCLVAAQVLYAISLARSYLVGSGSAQKISGAHVIGQGASLSFVGTALRRCCFHVASSREIAPSVRPFSFNELCPQVFGQVSPSHIYLAPTRAEASAPPGLQGALAPGTVFRKRPHVRPHVRKTWLSVLKACLPPLFFS